MSKSTTKASADLQRLLNEGYELGIREGYLLIHHVPYVTPERRVEFGSLISTLQLAGDRLSPPTNTKPISPASIPATPRATR